VRPGIPHAPPAHSSHVAARGHRAVSRPAERAFPEIAIEVAATADKAVAALADTDMLITFGQMIKNLKLDFAAARNLKWVQALGTGLDGITDQPALKPGVTVTSLHGVHGAPVSEAALASMLALSRDLPGFVRAQDRAQWKRWPAKLLQSKTSASSASA
jgi:phosphoglycerate dehydrogenase-like enzyme